MTLADLSVLMGGVAAVALLAWWFFGPEKSAIAVLQGDVQEIEVQVIDEDWSDRISVTAGEPLHLIFDRHENSDCALRLR